MTKIGLIDLKNYKKIDMYMEIVFFYNISDTPMDRMKGSLKKFQWIEWRDHWKSSNERNVYESVEDTNESNALSQKLMHE